MPRIRGSRSNDQTDLESDNITTVDNNEQDDKNIVREEVADEGESLKNVQEEDGNRDGDRDEEVVETKDIVRKWPKQDPAKQHKHEKKPADTNDNDNSNASTTNGNDKPVETDVIYPTEMEGELIEEEEQHQEQQDTSAYEQEDEPCPPLFIESSSDLEFLPSFPQRLICNADESIGTHPALYFTAFLTILFFFYCACSRKNRSYFRRRKGGHDSKVRGDYTALDTVYNELLDDFEDEEMSSCLLEEDDDSVGTIVSQWSEGGLHSNGFGEIELSSFDDDHLSLREMNG